MMLAPSSPFETLPRKYYRAIAIDAPMRFKAYVPAELQPWSHRRDNERHYRTMSFEELKALPIRELAAPSGCHVFLWTSGPYYARSLELIEAWRFKFSTRCFTWVKTKPSWDGESPLALDDFHMITGHTVRHQTEQVLLARCGNCRRKAKDVRELIFAPRREHSRKPDEFFRRVERYCDGPYLELFARERRSGWDSWGDEVDKFSSTIGAGA